MTAVLVTWPDTGQLTRRVKIRRQTSVANVDMGLTETFDAGVDRWAAIQPVSGAAFWGSQQVDEGITHRIWVRWGTGSKPEDITQRHVIDYAHQNQRFRVMRALNVGDAKTFTMIEVKLLGPIS